MIVVYSRDSCAPCRQLKAYLKHKGIEFEEKNVDLTENLDELIGITGLTMVPVTVVIDEHGNRSVVSGYNLSRLTELLS